MSTSPSALPRRIRTTVAAVLALLVATLGVGLALAPDARAATGAMPCSTAGAWRQGELNVYWFDVEQGDSQLIVGPTGKTLLIDLGETAYNSKGTSTNASDVAAQIRNICGTGSSPVALDYVMASHHHLDHIGYAGNPNDTTAYGNGLYQLLTPTSTGGLGFGVGEFLDHDGGAWTDANADKDCDVGTSAAPAGEIAWHNVGTTSATASRFICWLYGPAGQADRAEIAGKVTTLTNSSVWPTLDLGGGASAKVVEANAKGVMQADGSTPVSGNHSTDATPPSENDYSIGLKVTYGSYSYATAGDSDGEYQTSANGYTYNNVEGKLIAGMGTVSTVRANHHGSSHSSSDAYVNALKPKTSVISCGTNSFGHPSNHTLNAFRAVGADIFLLNDPCDTVDDSGATIDYSGTYNHNGTIHLATQNAGANYTIDYDAGTRSYLSGSGGGAAGDPTQVKVNEISMAPTSPANEWVELYNPTAQTVDIGGYYVDDVANGGGAPKQVPAGTTIPAGGRWVFEFASGFLNNTGSDSARFTDPSGTQIDGYDYSISTSRADQVFHRVGDGGVWCGALSTNVTKGTANPGTCP